MMGPIPLPLSQPINELDKIGISLGLSNKRVSEELLGSGSIGRVFLETQLDKLLEESREVAL